MSQQPTVKVSIPNQGLPVQHCPPTVLAGADVSFAEPTLAAIAWGSLAPQKFTNFAQTASFIDQSCQELMQQGVAVAIAPLAQNTWHSYRCITASNGRPLFFLEPEWDQLWHQALTHHQFQAIAHYLSTECHDLTIQDPRRQELHDHFMGQGITIHSPSVPSFTNVLKQIYPVAIAAFAHNFLFTPIGLSEFMSLYQPLGPYLNFDLILLAQSGEELVGFLFGVPDIFDPTGASVILKTVAISPNRKWAGLGRYLIALFHQRAAAMGYQRIVHSLMHTHNSSCNLSRHYQTQIFRKYGLFAKYLKPF